jgi:hypothetical protein
MVREDRVYFFDLEDYSNVFNSNTGGADQTSENTGGGFAECVLTDEQMAELKSLKAQYETELSILKQRLVEKDKELKTSQRETADKQKKQKELRNSCDTWKDSLTKAKGELNNYTEGTLKYEKQRDVIAYFQGKVDDCLKRANINITEYDTIFITSYCNTNEYEGDITIYGDPTWNSDVELLHACGSMGYICPTPNEVVSNSVSMVIKSENVNREILRKTNGDDITDAECCKKLSGNLIEDDSGNLYCNRWDYFYNRY